VRRQHHVSPATPTKSSRPRAWYARITLPEPGVAKARKIVLPDITKLPGARMGLLWVFLEPSLALLCEKPPRGSKWNGYRMQARNTVLVVPDGQALAKKHQLLFPSMPHE
jgi:hypothetical protein